VYIFHEAAKPCGTFSNPYSSFNNIRPLATMLSNRLFSAFRNTTAFRNIAAFRNTQSGKFIRDTSGYLFIFATWIPAVIFFNENVGEVTNINGPSMYPYLNTSYNETLTKDRGWVNKWRPAEKLKRGMLVSFWYTGVPRPPLPTSSY